MAKELKIAAWNANGLHRRTQVQKMFVSETPLTDKHFIKIPYYTIYDTKHLSGKGHGGSAVIIKDNIKHHFHNNCNQVNLQATTVNQTINGPFKLSAVYFPPKHKLTMEDYTEFF